MRLITPRLVTMLRAHKCAAVRLTYLSCMTFAAVGCATLGFGGKDSTTASGEAEYPAAPTDTTESQRVAVGTLSEAPAVRDNRSAPILAIVTISGTVYPYVYGYPLHPDGDAASGVAQLRRDNAKRARQKQNEDDNGVVRVVEDLPTLGCSIEGVRESELKYVPVALSCELPAPKALGGNTRPVLGTLSAGAKAEEVLKEPTVQENFLGAFHLTSDDFATGSGTGYFNTTHGQLALVFERSKLARFIYYFDPDVQSWQNPRLWTRTR